jgi:hypothetical protein
MMTIDHIREELLKLGEQETDIVGCSVEEIEQLKTIQGVTNLPQLYIEFLLSMGKKMGKFFTGASMTYWSMQYMNFKKEARLLLAENSINFDLPENVYIFLIHNGYIFMYFDTSLKDYDPLVYRYIEGDVQPKQAGYFSDLLLGELGLQKKLAESKKL